MARHLITGGAFRGKLFSDLLAQEAEVSAPLLAAGTQVGVWCIVRLLARGGMSEVYLAERMQGDFAQTVAIKIIATQVDATELLREERRILGRLRHPAIATLIDGGELPSGGVWLAMEYVEGEPIHEHAAHHRLDWMGRVALVERLCEAVDHAHRHLLVHRDIKPSNVLVDAAGHAKLIDFGIAIAEHGQGDGQRWMTPGYAAPEQRRGETVTTATDLYQLGQLLRTLTAAEALPSAPPAPTRHDLDRVLARATRADPHERHASAAALAADLAALRTLRPLPSDGSSRLHRLRLWHLRHAWAPWVALPVLLLLLASAMWSLRSGWREADERALAVREEQVASAIGSFFIDLFNEPVNAEEAKGGVTALLDRGQRRLRERPAVSAEVQAGLLSQLALTNVQMERRDMAIELLEEAIRVQRRAGLQAPLAGNLAVLARLRSLAGDSALGAQLAADAAAQLALDTRTSRDRFLALNQLAEYHIHSYGFAEAETLLRAAVQVGVQRYGADSPELHRTRRLLLEVLRNQWRIDVALPLSADLTAACQRHFGAADARCVTEFIHWQRTRAMAGELDAARTQLVALWAQRDQWDGQLRHYREHAVLYGLSDVQALAGDTFASLDTLLASLCPLAQAEGRGSQHWVLDRGGMALQLLDLGATDLALQMSNEARTLYADSISLESAFWASRHARIELAASGDVSAELETRLRKAVDRMRTVYGDTSYYTARAELALARVETHRGRPEAALDLATRAARVQARGLRFHHPQLQADIDTLRAELSADPTTRIAQLRQAEARLRSSHAPDHPMLAAATLRRLQAESAAGQTVDTAAALRVLQTFAAQQVSHSPALIQARHWLASLGVAPAALPQGRPLTQAEPVCP